MQGSGFVAFVGRHSAGKSHLASLMYRSGWEVRRKQDYLTKLHRESGEGGNTIEWYRRLYHKEGARRVTERLVVAGLLDAQGVSW